MQIAKAANPIFIHLTWSLASKQIILECLDTTKYFPPKREKWLPHLWMKLFSFTFSFYIIYTSQLFPYHKLRPTWTLLSIFKLQVSPKHYSSLSSTMCDYQIILFYIQPENIKWFPINKTFSKKTHISWEILSSRTNSSPTSFISFSR